MDTSIDSPEITTIINGSLIDSVSVRDRGLQYGDGFFSTLLVTGNLLLNWPGHWRRVQNAAHRLQFPVIDEQELFTQVKQAVAVFNYTKSSVESNKVVKVIFTRGVGGIGYQVPETPQITTILQVTLAPIQIEHETGSHLPIFSQPQAIELGVCETLASIQPQLAGLKHLNRLENVLARSEIVRKGLTEGVMLNAYQQVIGGTQSNLFLIKGQNLITPQLTDSGVEGTTRYQLSLLADHLNLVWKESTLFIEDLMEADGLFLANAVRGIMPVNLFNQKRFSNSKILEIHQAWSNWQRDNGVSLSLETKRAVQ
ncbi:MAG: aminodeoxychorismate lyase [Pseudomonadota bacterium]